MSETLQQLLLELSRDVYWDRPAVSVWDAVVARLRSHPTEATIKMRDLGTSRFRLPLHRALWCHRQENPMTVDVVKAFIAAHKDALFESDEDGTPLHIACYKGMSVELVKPLLEANPGAASVRNKFGKIPLHHAKNPEVVDKLLGAYPEGVGCEDKRGRLPLHYAVYSSDERSLRILHSLLRAGEQLDVVDSTGGLFVKDKEGRTPLMIACDMQIVLLRDFSLPCAKNRSVPGTTSDLISAI